MLDETITHFHNMIYDGKHLVLQLLLKGIFFIPIKFSTFDFSNNRFLKQQTCTTILSKQKLSTILN